LRATSTISSATTNYTWGQLGSNAQLLSDGTWDYLYVPGSNVPVEQVAASGSSPAADLLLSDPNASVRGIVQLTSGSHQDQLVNYTDYDAYGNPITQAGGSVETGGLTAAQTSINSNYVATTPFGFGGGYTDATGLIYLVHRYYDPSTGQFLSVDPELATTNQPYVYTGDDPVNETDPTGKWVVGICGSIAVYWGGGAAGTACLDRTEWEPWDEVGFTETLGFGFGIGGSLSLGLLVSNAQHIEDLRGWFNEATVGLGEYSLNVFWGRSSYSGQTVVGAIVQYGVGLPAGLWGGWDYTWTSVETGWIANPLRWVFDGVIYLVGGLGVVSYWMAVAHWIAHE
jgi:RHS repeat-associated protein